MKNKIILTVIIFIFILFIGNFVNAANQEDVYDVILFWGQSNMQGAAGVKWDNFKETRIETEGVEKFSNMTGIREDILKNTTQVDHVNVSQVAGTVFEYVYSNGLFSEQKGELKEINMETENIGQNLYYSPNTKLLHLYTGEQEYCSLQKSHGTNMIPQFCNQYYKKTGHKVVAVLCARGGTSIRHFLPKDTNKEPYVYEAMAEKYKSAVKYLEDNGYNIGKKLYVACQGEADVALGTSQSNYESSFIKVHNYLKEDLGIERGAIVLTSRTIGKDWGIIQNIHNAQINLIRKNEDEIILGSEFLYNNYIPDSSTYENNNYINKKYMDSKGNKLSYNEALKRARLSTCYKDDENQNNELHFTSAALSQVGYEVANAFSSVNKIEIVNKPKKTQYIIKYESLNLDGGKIRVVFGNGEVQQINMSDSGVKISGFSNNALGEKTIIVSYQGKISTFTVKIVKATLTGIKISESPTDLSYIEGQDFNSVGMKVVANYNDGTSKEITNYTVVDGKYLEKEKTSVTISYEENGVTKTAEQGITVVEKSLTSIEVKTCPSKTSYYLGENINLEGLVLTGAYNNGTTEEISEGFECIPSILSTVGTQIITVSYGGKSTTFNVTVVLKGDANADSKVDFMDILAINKHRLNKEVLTGAGLKAADVTEDGQVNFIDILEINKYRLGKINSL